MLVLWARLPAPREPTAVTILDPDENGEIKIPLPLGKRIPEVSGYKAHRIVVVDVVARVPRVVIDRAREPERSRSSL
jgi:hypothetical protein